MILISKLNDFWLWFRKWLTPSNPVEDYLAQSVDRADYVARFKQLRHRGYL